MHRAKSEVLIGKKTEQGLGKICTSFELKERWSLQCTHRPLKLEINFAYHNRN